VLGIALLFLSCLFPEISLHVCLLSLAFLAAAQWCLRRPQLRLGRLSVSTIGGVLWTLWGVILAAPLLAYWKEANNLATALVIGSLSLALLLIWSAGLASLRLPAPWHYLRRLSWACGLGFWVWMLLRLQTADDLVDFDAYSGVVLGLIILTIVQLAISRDHCESDTSCGIRTRLVAPGILLILLMMGWSEISRKPLLPEATWAWILPMAGLPMLLISILWQRPRRGTEWTRALGILACCGLLWELYSTPNHQVALSRLDVSEQRLLDLLALAVAGAYRMSRDRRLPTTSKRRIRIHALLLLAFGSLLAIWVTRSPHPAEGTRLMFSAAFFLVAVAVSRWAGHLLRERPRQWIFAMAAEGMVLGWAVFAMDSFLHESSFVNLFQAGLVCYSIFLAWAAALAALVLEPKWLLLRRITWAVGAVCIVATIHLWSGGTGSVEQLVRGSLIGATLLTFLLTWFGTPTRLPQRT